MGGGNTGVIDCEIDFEIEALGVEGLGEIEAEIEAEGPEASAGV